MYDLITLITLTFLRDKAAVFFSLLSVIILLALYFLLVDNTRMVLKCMERI